MPQVTTYHFDEAAVTSYTQAGGGSAVAGPLNGAKFVLFTNTITPTKNTPLSALTPPTYTGYAPAAVTWGAAVIDASNDVVTFTGTMPVQMGSSSDLPETIMGYGLTDSAGTNLLLVEVFATPLALANNLVWYGVVVPFAPGNPTEKTAQIIA